MLATFSRFSLVFSLVCSLTKLKYAYSLFFEGREGGRMEETEYTFPDKICLVRKNGALNLNEYYSVGTTNDFDVVM